MKRKEPKIHAESDRRMSVLYCGFEMTRSTAVSRDWSQITCRSCLAKRIRVEIAQAKRLEKDAGPPCE